MKTETRKWQYNERYISCVRTTIQGTAWIKLAMVGVYEYNENSMTLKATGKKCLWGEYLCRGAMKWRQNA